MKRGLTIWLARIGGGIGGRAGVPSALVRLRMVAGPVCDGSTELG